MATSSASMTLDPVQRALPAQERGAILSTASYLVVLVVSIGALDVASGTELSLSPLYLIAVIIGAWRGGPWLGLATAIASTVIGSISAVLLSDPYMGFELS